MVDVSGEFRAHLEACEHQYTLHFAGQSRLTRESGLLEALAEVLAALVPQLPAALVPAAAAQLQRYQDEHAAILAAQAAAGMAGCALAHLRQRMERVLHRYQRHFAGRSRPGRDLGLLRSMLVELGHLRGEVAPFGAPAASLLQQLDTAVATYTGELEAISRSRAVADLADRVHAWRAAMATLALTFTALVTGRSQLACSAGLVQRLGTELAECLAGHAAATSGAADHAAFNTEVEATLTDWLEIADQVTAAQSSAAPAVRQAALEAELDAILEAFNVAVAGPPPPTAAVVALCDRMDDLGQQLRQLAVDGGSDSAELALVATDSQVVLNDFFDALSAPAAA